MQIQYVLVCVPQPSRHFSRLERRIPGTEVAIEHVSDFFGRAWLSDLVQGTPYVFVEGIRIWNLAHFWLSGVGSQFVERCSFLCWCTFYLKDTLNKRSC